MATAPLEISSPDAERLSTVALERAQSAGARHVEVRWVSRQRENLGFADEGVETSSAMRDRGLGIRVLVGDCWGYAGTNLLSDAAIAQAARHAVDAAKAGTPESPDGVAIAPAVQGHYQTPLERDPFTVPADEKIALFNEALSEMEKAGGSAIKRRRASYTGQRLESLFMTSHGSRIHQAVTLCGGGVTAIAERDGIVQRRSLPKADEGDVLQAGWEHVAGLDLKTAAARVAREAVALTQASQTAERVTTVILGGAQLSLHIHESVGHPTELDRVYGQEVSLAGSSFLVPEAIDKLQYGSSLVNLTADSTTPGGPGTFGFDDEGTAALKQDLVRDGKLVGFLSGRDAANRLGRDSAACLRAESWSHLPIVRMVNVNLEPGQGSLEDLIGGVDDGLLIDQNKSWSIDDLRLNFQFGCEVAWEIKGGKLTGRLFRDPVYTGVTPKFWSRCAAIAGPQEWRVWGYMWCGKGDPVQVMHVGHGCAPTRFDNVRVRSTG